MRDFNVFISLFISFSDIWKSDRRFSSGLKIKLIHVTKVGVSSNSTR